MLWLDGQRSFFHVGTEDSWGLAGRRTESAVRTMARHNGADPGKTIVLSPFGVIIRAGQGKKRNDGACTSYMAQVPAPGRLIKGDVDRPSIDKSALSARCEVAWSPAVYGDDRKVRRAPSGKRFPRVPAS
jgi:hypothetical protein